MAIVISETFNEVAGKRRVLVAGNSGTITGSAKSATITTGLDVITNIQGLVPGELVTGSGDFCAVKNSPSDGKLKISHIGAAGTDRTFEYNVIGFIGQ
jgi:hypothetical protein